MKLSVHTATDIQNHLYQALLAGTTTDVALRVHGSWSAVYRLHRVVLIQAGFFKTLFDGGFRESSPTLHGTTSQQVDVIFDDPNITRAAFEVCISRLYGGGPPLHLDARFVPTARDPLTPSLPELGPPGELPVGHQPATPRFLLSLLATALYLQIPSIVSKALDLILSSVGPRTAVRYLNFAIGQGIGEKAEDDRDAAVGLEHVGMEPVESRALSLSRSSTIEDASIQHDPYPSFVDMDVGSIRKEDPADMKDYDTVAISTKQETVPSYYGPISDKIGEVTVCWLARWAADILPYEESIEATNARQIPPLWARGGLNSTWVRVLLSSDSFFVKGERERYNIAKRVVDLRRSRGLHEDEEKEWEELFTSGIYYMHMPLDDLMLISTDISPHTGRTYVPLAVLQSAHWSHSLLRLRMTVRSSPGGPSRSPPPQDKELGIAMTTSQMREAMQDPQSDVQLQGCYYPVPADSSKRFGDNGTLDGASVAEQLLSSNQPPKDNQTPNSAPSESNFFGILTERRSPATCIASDPSGKVRWSPFPPIRFGVEFWGVEGLREKSRLHSHTIWYAGSLFNVYVQVVRKKSVQLGVYLHRQSSVDPLPMPSLPPAPSTKASAFAMSNLALALASEEQRALTNQASRSSLPSSSESSGVIVSRPSSARGHERSNSVPSRSGTPSSPSSPQAGSPLSAAGTHFTLPPPHLSPSSSPAITVAAPVQPYRDPRPSILAFFSIYCASATGSALTRFSSSPDVFSISQSWGWKSSSLRTEEFMEVVTEGEVANLPPPLKKEVSLRATVVLGVV